MTMTTRAKRFLVLSALGLAFLVGYALPVQTPTLDDIQRIQQECYEDTCAHWDCATMGDKSCLPYKPEGR